MTQNALLQLLKWESPRGLLHLERFYRARLESLMDGLLNRAAGPSRPRAKRIRKRLKELPQTSYRQLLSAPEMVHRLTCPLPIPATLVFIERAVEGKEIPAGTPAANGIPIDHLSRYARACFIRGLPPYSRFEDNEIRSFTRKICHAIEAVQVISPIAAEATGRFVKEIVVRRNPRSPRKYVAFSWYRYIGRMGIVNPHARGFNTMRATNSVVHETIHAVEYVHELQTPMVTDHSLAGSTWVRSPWTGNEISLHSLAGACMVWFGLWNFWRLPAARSVFSASVVERYVERCARGFRSGRFDEVLDTPIILQDFRHCVLQMRRIVG